MIRSMYIGKFQPFHNGHLKVVNLLKEISDEVLICLGSPKSSSNFTLKERKQMVFENTHIEPIIVQDLNRNHPLYEDWGKYVLDITGQISLLATGNGKVSEDFIRHDIPILWLPRYENINGSSIRDKITTGDELWKKLVSAETLKIIENSNFYKT